MNARHLKNDALDVIEESPGSIHVAHFRVKLGPINESTRCLPALSLIGFFEEEVESSRCSAKNAGQRGSYSQLPAVTDQWDDGVGWRVRVFWEVGWWKRDVSCGN